MKPEDFARQFFDMWQDSFDNAMENPTFNAKLMHLMEQSNVLWNNNEKNNVETVTETPKKISNGSPYQQLAQSYDHRDGTVSQLASRLEKCEQRIQVLETILRSQLGQIPEHRERRPQGERNARIQIPKGA